MTVASGKQRGAVTLSPGRVGVGEAARGDTAHTRARVDIPAEVSAKALRQAMRPGRQKQGGGQEHHQEGGQRRAAPRGPSQAQESYQAIRASQHQQTQALRWAPETPSGRKGQAIRGASFSCTPTTGPEPTRPPESSGCIPTQRQHRQ